MDNNKDKGAFMNKTVLITGASRGIGKAIATEFAKKGYSLVIGCHTSSEKLEELKKELTHNYSVDILTSVGDIGDFSYVTQLIEDAQKAFGGIDILVNNAGISHIGLLSDMTPEEWHNMMNTNLNSLFYTSKLALPYMISKQEGKIINISSVWGNVGASCEVAYSTTKGGINAFTKALAKELAPSNIQVNAIACGCIDTEMNQCFSKEERRELEEGIPAGRFGTPEEVAQLVLSLAEGHNYMTGQIITIDGGWT